jgi:hypothetical protein
MICILIVQNTKEMAVDTEVRLTAAGPEDDVNLLWPKSAVKNHIDA